MRYLADRGFTAISMEPVVGPPEAAWSIREEHLPDICRSYERLAQLYLERQREGRPFRFFHFAIDLDRGPCAAKRASGCGVGSEYVAVTPEGDLYPCHQFVGEKEFRMGSVWEPDAFREDVRAPFTRNTVYDKAPCRSCWARFYCSGGCSANGWFSNRNIADPETVGCAMEKKRVECALALRAIASREAEEEA